MTRRVHIVGAGLSGLSAAVRLALAGCKVSVYEAARFGGGRCRSFFDDTLQTTIDNGAHLMLSGNTDIQAYIGLIGSANEVIVSDRARFDFLDVQTDQTWCVDLGAGKGLFSLVQWLFDAKRRPPNVGPVGLMVNIFALKHGHGQTVLSCLNPDQKQYKSFWEPLCMGVLNAAPSEASAELLWAVLKETVLLGGWAARPLLTRNGLGSALVDPALEKLKHLKANVSFNNRVQSLEHNDGHVTCLNLAKGAEILGSNDRIIIAVPHFAIEGLVEGGAFPQDSHAILNVHYILEHSVKAGLKGLVGSPVQWVFTRNKIASATISAADDWVTRDSDEIAAMLWPDVSKALGLVGSRLPKFRVIKEKRATFAQDPDALIHRAQTKTRFDNLFLAGDWTDTKLPATIEGALRSGRKAAEAVIESLSALTS